MDQHVIGRVLMGDSLGFHIIFALLGVGLPLAVLILEYLGLRRRDAYLLQLAKRWSLIAGILVITGVLSGTVVALQMFLVWPGILQFGGKAIGLGFAWEGYAFILEAIFLGFYLKTWDTLKGWAHWALMVPVWLGATLSAFLITSVDAWMNHPVGITVTNGVVTAAEPLKAVFNQTSILQGVHSILGYYLTALLLVAGVMAIRLLSRPSAKQAASLRQALHVFGFITASLLVVIALFGDLSARYLANFEPAKLAAIESLSNTQTNAPLVVGELVIPGFLSWLIGGDTDTLVQGLNAVKPGDTPPLVIHSLFDVKLVLIAGLTTMFVAFVGLYFARRSWATSPPMLALFAISPIASAAIIELGWMVTEIGRQPYAVYGYVTTKAAFTTSPGVAALAWLFPAAYVVLTLVTVAAIWKVARMNLGGKAS